MRVPNISTYYAATYRLGNLTEDLKTANEVVSTQKRINEISDDPLGLSQVLSLRNSIGNLEQIEQNVIMGKSWLEGVEASLGSVNNLILDVKSEVSRLANDSTTFDERQNAVARIDHIINQIVSLGNTQVNGSYIFGGTKTNVRPFAYDTSVEPNRVLYKGNETPFEIRTDRNSGVQVGRDGKATFWDTNVEINGSNNTIVFKEDNGHGSASEKVMEAVIPEGLYTKKGLETSIRNVLNDVSQKQGYGVTYDVQYDEKTQRYAIQEDGSFNGYIRTRFMWETGEQAYINHIQVSEDIRSQDVDINVLNHDALTIGTMDNADDPKPFTLTWNKQELEWNIDNNPGYVMPGAVSGTASGVDIDLNENGFADIQVRFDEPVQDGAHVAFDIMPAKDDSSIGHEIGFNENDMIHSPPVSDYKAGYITDLKINAGVNDKIVFQEINTTGGAATMTAGIDVTGSPYTDMGDLSRAIEAAMETQSDLNGNSIDYAVSYDPETSRFNIRENGATLNELNLMWTASTASAGTTLGYYPMDDAVTYPHSSITIHSGNNVIDFQEENTAGTFTTLQTRIPAGEYADMESLAAAVETAMETVSTSDGNIVDYDVSYDPVGSQLAITGSATTAGTAVTGINLLWNSGSGAVSSIGETLGYDPEADDLGAGLGPYAGDAEPVRMSLFSTTIDDTNNWLDFEEVSTAGAATTLQAQIPSGTYTSVSDLHEAVEKSLNQASADAGNGVRYNVSYDEGANQFGIHRSGGADLNELNLLWASGPNAGETIAGTLGYDPGADATGDGLLPASAYKGAGDPVWMSFDADTNKIDFRETRIDGTVSEERTIEIPPNDYTHPDQVAARIQTALRKASPNNIQYNVLYDKNQGFMIKGSSEQIKGFDLLWQTGTHSSASAAEKLGFDGTEDISVTYAESDRDIVNITIDDDNNKLDFKEITPEDQGTQVSNLTAVIKKKDGYTSHETLAVEIEKALESESRKNGNTIDYHVFFDDVTKQFTIKENGTRLDELHLQWHSGDNAPLSQGGTGQSIGSVIGFEGTSDDVATPVTGVRDAEWGIFNTLIDLKQYLTENDRDGIERTIGRLELNFDNMTSRIVDTGMKFSRLQVRQTITTEVNLSLTERRSMIEDADMIESIMKLQGIETAYRAALASTSKVLNMSLVDYLR